MINNNWQNLFLLAEIVISTGLILYSLINLNRFEEIRKEKIQNRWLYLLCIILILAYVYIAYYALNSEFTYLLLITCSACLFSAFIIWAVTKLTISVATDLKKSAAVEHYHATHDDLTGLPNLTFFNEQLELILEEAKNNQNEVALLIIDLNRFQLINETIGYFGGDLMLQEIAQRIQRSLRKTDLVARLGGDEFAVIINPVVATGHLHTISKNIAESVQEPLAVDNKPADVGVSIGMSIFPTHAKNTLELINNSRTAMLEAKQSGTQISIFNPATSEDSIEDIQIIGMLQRSIHEQQLSLLFQPQIRLQDMKLASVEALIRWDHPNYGQLDPSSFVPYAERAGLIHEINSWLLQEVTSLLEQWSSKNIDLPIAINVTVNGFLNKNFQQMLTSLFKKSPQLAHMLKIELTETSTIEDAKEIVSSIKKFKKNGLKFILDDYGTRHASLEYLKLLPFDEFKVDRSFMINAISDKDSKAIILHAKEIANQLGLSITAEGIENKETLKLAKKNKFDYGQGYYISSGVTADTIEKHIEQHGLDGHALLKGSVTA